MFSVEQRATISRSATDLFDFLANFENRPQFESAVVEARKTSDGPVSAGTRFREVRKSFGMRTVTEFRIDSFTRPESLGFASTSGPVGIEGRYRLSETGGQTTVLFEMTVTPRGIMRLFEPMMASSIRRALPDYYATLKRVLEAPAGT